MNKEAYFSKIPQSVLVCGSDFKTLCTFVGQWSARLLTISEAEVAKCPDFHAVWPTGKMRQISVDALREFNRNVYVTAHRNGRKVFVIYEADRLNGAAANALLKTLEEPTADTSIFLVTVRPYDLLPTLRSRCWFVQINEAASEERDEALEAWLSDFKQKILTVCMQKSDVSPMHMYGLLYRLQAYLSKKIESLSLADDETLSEEEQAAQKAGLEKQCLQGIFRRIEQTLSAMVRDPQTFPSTAEFYPRWVSALEQCYRRTEVNFGAVAALEAFWLSFCSVVSQKA